MMNPDLIQELPKLNYCEQGNKIFVKPGVYPLSSRKLEGFMKIANLQKYYQCNPVRFINDFFNIELLDAQAWVIQRAWNCPNVLLVCTRGFGKSTLIDIMIMAKDMLFNNYWTYIASGSGSQAEQTFTTLERLANDNIDTMLGSTGYIFKAEIEIKNAAGDGFSHSSNGFSYSLYNGSFTETLFNSSGGAQILNSATISGTTAFGAAIRADTELAISMLLPQTQGWVNRFLTYWVSNPAKVKFFEVSAYTKDEFKKELLEGAQNGLPTALAYNTLNQFSEKETLALNVLEQQVLGISNLFVPLQTSYTQSGSSDTGGAPTKDSTEITDDGEASKDKADKAK